MRLVVLVSSPRVAAGLLSADAWAALHSGPVFIVDDASPAGIALAAAGVVLRPVDASRQTDDVAAQLVDAAAEHGTATWWVGADGDHDLVRRVTELLREGGAGQAIDVEVLHGSWDLPGARLVDVVATMDRLRSPGGCPWDAEQDHASLAPYLLEEAYEAFQAIEDGDSGGLREELGDVLLQVAFHARLAEELPEAERWTIDDVAAGLVDKLVRRHPHVFGGVAVSGSDEVNANWETIKAAERGSKSVLSNVPMSAPALTLAATLQRKAARAGLATDDGDSRSPAGLLDASWQGFVADPSVATAGELLWRLVEATRAADVDAEAALRHRARQFRDDVEPKPAGD
jgi:XTP/dITP diphosphohydrolase